MEAPDGEGLGTPYARGAVADMYIYIYMYIISIPTVNHHSLTPKPLNPSNRVQEIKIYQEPCLEIIRTTGDRSQARFSSKNDGLTIGLSKK